MKEEEERLIDAWIDYAKITLAANSWLQSIGGTRVLELASIPPSVADHITLEYMLRPKDDGSTPQ